MNKKAVILVSGGLDSLTCLAQAVHEGFECYALTFYYGQRHVSEVDAAKRIISKYPVAEHKLIKILLDEFGGSALTDLSIPVPDYSDSDEIPVTYVPARNTIFIAIALGYAEVVSANTIIIA